MNCFPILTCTPTGLHLTLFIEFPEYVGFLTEESGVRIAIHPKKTYPFPEDIGISLAPGYVTSIGLRQVRLCMTIMLLVYSL